MKDTIQGGLIAVGAVALYFGLKEHLGMLFSQHPNFAVIIGLGLILGSGAIAKQIIKIKQ